MIELILLMRHRFEKSDGAFCFRITKVAFHLMTNSPVKFSPQRLGITSTKRSAQAELKILAMRFYIFADI